MNKKPPVCFALGCFDPQGPRWTSRLGLFALAGLATLFGALTPSATATAIIWTGGGGTGFWSTAANWNPNTTFTVNLNDQFQFGGATGLINTNDFAGDTNGGITFQITAGAFTLNPGAGGTTLQGGDVVNLSSNLQTINQNLQITGGTRNFFADNYGGSLTINGNVSQDASSRAVNIQGNNGIIPSSVTFGGANSYTGATLLGTQPAAGGLDSAGAGPGGPALVLNFAVPGAPVNNMLYPAGISTATTQEFNDAGCDIILQGSNGVANVQTIGNINAGGAHMNVNLIPGAAGGSMTLNMAKFTTGNGNPERAGTMNFIIPAGANVTTTMTNTLQGIIGSSVSALGMYVINGTDWPYNDGAGNFAPLPESSFYTNDLATANVHLDVMNSGMLQVNSLWSMRFNQPSNIVLDLSGGTLSLGASAGAGCGAILITPNVGANTTTITDGSIKGVAARTLVVHNYNTSGDTIIAANIVDASTINCTFTGPGRTILQGSNTWANTTGTYITGQSIVSVSSNANLGSITVGPPLQINNGTLQATATFALDNNGSDPRPVIICNSGATFDVQGTNTLTIRGVISGSTTANDAGPLKKIGTGTLDLLGVNTYNGQTVVSNGTLIIGAAQTGTGAITATDGTTLQIAATGNSLHPSVLTLGISAGVTNNYSGISSTSVPPIAATTLNVNGQITVNIISGASTVGVYPLISFTGAIGGTGGFVLGTLPVGVAATIVTNPVNTSNTIALNVVSTGTADIWTGAVSDVWDVGVTSNWTFNSLTAVFENGNLTRFDDTASGTSVTIPANVNPASMLMVNNANTYTFSGLGQIVGSSGLTLNGTNTVILGVTDASTVGLTVNDGTLVIGDGTTNGAVDGPIVDDASVVFDLTNDVVYSSGISGSGSVTQNGGTNGVLQLVGNDTYAGNTIVQSGVLQAGGVAAIPYGPGVGNMVIDAGAVFDLDGNSGVTVNGLSGSGNVNTSIAGVGNPGGVTFMVGSNNATSTFSGSFSNSANLNPSSGGTTGSLGLEKVGTGTLYLTGTNYASGIVEFGGGILNVASFSDYVDANTPNSGPSALGTRYYAQESPTSAAAIGLLFLGGTLQYTGSTPQSTDRMIRMLNTTSTIDASGSNPGATLQFTLNDASYNLYDQPGTRTLQLTGSNTGPNAFTIHVRNQAGSATSVIKSGTGTWYLTNSVYGQDPFGALDNTGNTYTGSTTINAGILYASSGTGDTADSGNTGGGTAGTIGGGPYTVASGASLGFVNLNNGWRVRGTSLTASGGSTLLFTNVSSTGYPSVAYFPTVTINGPTTVTLQDTNNLVAGNEYPLIAYGTVSGYSSLSLTPLPPGLYGVLTNDTSGLWIALLTSSTPFVNPNPTNLTYSVSGPGPGSTLNLSWPGDHLGWTLQTNGVDLSQTNQWFDYPGSASVTNISITIPASGAVYFRMSLYP